MGLMAFGIDRRFFLAMGGVVLFGSIYSAMAGNKEMVEEAVQELDTLNKQAIEQLPEIPRDGIIDLKADVTYQDGSPIFDIYDEHVTPEKIEDIPLNQEYTIDLQTKGRTQP